MSTASLTYQYVSASYQNLLQISSSGKIFNGLGVNVPDLDVNVTSASSSTSASYSGVASVAVSASYSTSASYSGVASVAVSASYSTTASYALSGSGITINAYANNRLLTATGSSNTINAEQNLTFDGQKLQITHTLQHGYSTSAVGSGSHSEGSVTTSTGIFSHAEGIASISAGVGSHTEGLSTIANGDYQHVQGMYNLPSTNQGAFIIGNGLDEVTQSNLVYASGSRVDITGSLKVTQGITGSLLGIASVTNSIPTASINLATGSIYFNIITNTLYIYNGTAFKSASFF